MHNARPLEYFKSFLCCVICLSKAMAAPESPAPDSAIVTVDLGFEAGVNGELPANWFVPVEGWKAELSDQDATSGKRCVKLSLAEKSDAPFGNLMQRMDVSKYRGRRVRLSAKVRVEGNDASAMMWLRVDRAESQPGFFDNMGDRPIRTAKWTEAVIDGEVDTDAQHLAIGVMSLGGGTVFVDDMKLSFSEAVPVQAATPPLPIKPRGLENLMAAARLLAYVRYFHPSDEAVAVDDWDQLSVELMEAAEPAETSEQLADRLQQMFAPIAPSLTVWAGGLDAAPTLPPTPAKAEHLRYWVHHGAGRIAKGQSIYSSKYEQAPLPTHKEEVAATNALKSLIARSLGEADLAKAPESPYLLKSLGAGVSCRLPVMVYVSPNGSLPRAMGDNPWAKAGDRPRLSGLNRSTRLAGVATCWGVMQHFYPYFDVIKTDWNPALGSSLAQAAVDTDEIAYLHTLQKLVAHLHDGHANVFNPRTLKAKALPVALDWAGHELVVIGKHRSAPEQVAVGDVVVAINGHTVDKLCDELSLRISAATDGWRRKMLCQLLRTDASTVDPCSLRLRRPDRSEYGTSMSLCSSHEPIDSGPARPANGTELAPGIVYFDLSGAQAKALEAAWPKLASARGIVFDMRGYPGDAAANLLVRLHSERTASARWNIPIVTLPDREGWSWNESAWDLPSDKRQLTAKVAFLTDDRAISYAESIMGIVEHYRLGEIVGSSTAGTNGNVNPFTLPGEYHVTWTGMKVLKHDESPHHGVGIRPTIPIEPTPAGFAAGRDEVLEMAVESLRKRLGS